MQVWTHPHPLPCSFLSSRLLTSVLPYPRYRDYRNRDPNDKYNFTEQFWLLLAIRLAFVILFEVGRTGRG